MLLLFRKVSKKRAGAPEKKTTHIASRPHTSSIIQFYFSSLHLLLGFFFFFCYCVAIQVCCSSLRKTALNKSVHGPYGLKISSPSLANY